MLTKTKEKEKRIYGIRINYIILDKFLSNISAIKKARNSQTIDKLFEERIMLAVTQVNRCRMCSYYHTKEALRAGVEEEQIKDILSGKLKDIPKNQAAALLFAQHYAETIGNYDKKAWNKVVNIYGKQKAEAILAYIRAIMVGNAQGNIFGAFMSRIKGNPEPNSTFLKEIGVIFSGIFIIPFLLIKKILFSLMKNNAK